MADPTTQQAKWQYDHGRGGKIPIRKSKSSPDADWTTDGKSLPEIPEHLVVGRPPPRTGSKIPHRSYSSGDSEGQIHPRTDLVYANRGAMHFEPSAPQVRVVTPDRQSPVVQGEMRSTPEHQRQVRSTPEHQRRVRSTPEHQRQVPANVAPMHHQIPVQQQIHQGSHGIITPDRRSPVVHGQMRTTSEHQRQSPANVTPVHHQRPVQQQIHQGNRGVIAPDRQSPVVHGQMQATVEHQRQSPAKNAAPEHHQRPSQQQIYQGSHGVVTPDRQSPVVHEQVRTRSEHQRQSPAHFASSHHQMAGAPGNVQYPSEAQRHNQYYAAAQPHPNQSHAQYHHEAERLHHPAEPHGQGSYVQPQSQRQVRMPAVQGRMHVPTERHTILPQASSFFSNQHSSLQHHRQPNHTHQESQQRSIPSRQFPVMREQTSSTTHRTHISVSPRNSHGLEAMQRRMQYANEQVGMQIDHGVMHPNAVMPHARTASDGGLKSRIPVSSGHPQYSHVPERNGMEPNQRMTVSASSAKSSMEPEELLQSEILMRTNEDMVGMKIERDRLIHDLSEMLVDQSQADMLLESSDGLLGNQSDGSDSECEESWMTDNSQSSQEATMDMATQCSLHDEDESYTDVSELDPTESTLLDDVLFEEGNLTIINPHTSPSLSPRSDFLADVNFTVKREGEESEGNPGKYQRVSSCDSSHRDASVQSTGKPVGEADNSESVDETEEEQSGEKLESFTQSSVSTYMETHRTSTDLRDTEKPILEIKQSNVSVRPPNEETSIEHRAEFLSSLAEAMNTGFTVDERYKDQQQNGFLKADRCPGEYIIEKVDASVADVDQCVSNIISPNESNANMPGSRFIKDHVTSPSIISPGSNGDVHEQLRDASLVNRSANEIHSSHEINREIKRGDNENHVTCDKEKQIPSKRVDIDVDALLVHTSEHSDESLVQSGLSHDAEENAPKEPAFLEEEGNELDESLHTFSDDSEEAFEEECDRVRSDSKELHDIHAREGLADISSYDTSTEFYTAFESQIMFDQTNGADDMTDRDEGSGLDVTISSSVTTPSPTVESDYCSMYGSNDAFINQCLFGETQPDQPPSSIEPNINTLQSHSNNEPHRISSHETSGRMLHRKAPDCPETFGEPQRGSPPSSIEPNINTIQSHSNNQQRRISSNETSGRMLDRKAPDFPEAFTKDPDVRSVVEHTESRSRITAPNVKLAKISLAYDTHHTKSAVHSQLPVKTAPNTDIVKNEPQTPSTGHSDARVNLGSPGVTKCNDVQERNVPKENVSDRKSTNSKGTKRQIPTLRSHLPVRKGNAVDSRVIRKRSEKDATAVTDEAKCVESSSGKFSGKQEANILLENQHHGTKASTDIHTKIIHKNQEDTYQTRAPAPKFSTDTYKKQSRPENKSTKLAGPENSERDSNDVSIDTVTGHGVSSPRNQLDTDDADLRHTPNRTVREEPTVANPKSGYKGAIQRKGIPVMKSKGASKIPSPRNNCSPSKGDSRQESRSRIPHSKKSSVDHPKASPGAPTNGHIRNPERAIQPLRRSSKDQVSHEGAYNMHEITPHARDRSTDNFAKHKGRDDIRGPPCKASETTDNERKENTHIPVLSHNVARKYMHPPHKRAQSEDKTMQNVSVDKDIWEKRAPPSSPTEEVPPSPPFDAVPPSNPMEAVTHEYHSEFGTKDFRSQMSAPASLHDTPKAAIPVNEEIPVELASIESLINQEDNKQMDKNMDEPNLSEARDESSGGGTKLKHQMDDPTESDSEFVAFEAELHITESEEETNPTVEPKRESKPVSLGDRGKMRSRIPLPKSKPQRGRMCTSDSESYFSEGEGERQSVSRMFSKFNQRNPSQLQTSTPNETELSVSMIPNMSPIHGSMDANRASHTNVSPDHKRRQRSHSFGEVRPRGNLWAYSNTPEFATTDAHRSQTLKTNRSRKTTPVGTPKGGSLRRKTPKTVTSPTFKSRECAIVPLPEWNKLRDIISSTDHSTTSTPCPSSPGGHGSLSRRSSGEFSGMSTPTYGSPLPSPKRTAKPNKSRWRIDGRVPTELKEKYSPRSNRDDDADKYLTEDEMLRRHQELKGACSVVHSSTDLRSLHSDVKQKREPQNPDRERAIETAAPLPRINRDIEVIVKDNNAERIAELPKFEKETFKPELTTTDGDLSEFSRPDLRDEAKRKSWKKRLSLKKKKPAAEKQTEEPADIGGEKKKRKKKWRWLRWLGIRR